jgi:receptor expression-enhancing protein 5/6
MIGWAASKGISQLVGFVYPAFQSFKALQTKTDDDDTQWLTYWVVFSVMITFEHVFEFLISWLPFYYEFKVLFQLWLTFTDKAGKIIYEAYVQELFQALSAKIESMLASSNPSNPPVNDKSKTK